MLWRIPWGSRTDLAFGSRYGSETSDYCSLVSTVFVCLYVGGRSWRSRLQLPGKSRGRNLLQGLVLQGHLRDRVQRGEQTVSVLLDRLEVHLVSRRQEQRVLQVWNGGCVCQDCAGCLPRQLAGAERLLLTRGKQVQRHPVGCEARVRLLQCPLRRNDEVRMPPSRFLRSQSQGLRPARKRQLQPRVLSESTELCTKCTHR